MYLLLTVLYCFGSRLNRVILQNVIILSYKTLIISTLSILIYICYQCKLAINIMLTQPVALNAAKFLESDV